MADVRQVRGWLQNKGIEVKEEWLMACLQWLQSEDVGILRTIMYHESFDVGASWVV